MKIDYRNGKNIDSPYRVISTETKKEIPDCRWADDEIEKYCILVRDNNGNIERQWKNPEYRHLPLESWLTPDNEKYGGIIIKEKIKKGKIKIINMIEKKYIAAKCNACSGTGIYVGMAEPKDTGVICLICEGTGCKQIEYVPFIFKKKRNDIKEVKLSRGSFLLSCGPTGKSITYNEFWQGKLPKI